MHVANSLIPLHFSLGLASSGSSSKEVALRSESATKSDSLDSETKRLIRYFGRGYRTGGMSNPHIPDPDDESWLEMPLNIPPLQSIGPDPELIEIEDDSSGKASDTRRESGDVAETLREEEEEEEGEELAANEDVAEGETIGASSSQTQAEQGAEISSNPPRKRRKIVPVDPDLIPDRFRKEPCPYWQCFQNDKALRLFREVYKIPDDVVVFPVEGPRIKFSHEHITVPLMANTEGGLRFPMHGVIRELLYTFNLTPCQLSVNSYRLVHSVAKLADVRMFHLEAHHFFENYMMSRNLKYSRYYLCSRKKKLKLIVGDMYDSEKWASDYVEI